MKRILPLLLLLFSLGAVASAQETYSIPVPAAQIPKVDRARLTKNAETCRTLGLAPACTQAQACTVAGAPGGASCTLAQAQAAGVEIHAATLAGRESFLQSIVREHIRAFITQVDVEDRTSFCVWWRAAATTQTQRNNVCNASTPALGNGCNLCP